jgi:1,4-alpha-glucan branching enzyme
VPRDDYCVGVVSAGTWRKILDTDASRYGGSDYDRRDRFASHAASAQGYPHHVRLNLPPLAAVFLELER